MWRETKRKRTSSLDMIDRTHLVFEMAFFITSLGNVVLAVGDVCAIFRNCDMRNANSITHHHQCVLTAVCLTEGCWMADDWLVNGC